MMQTRNSGGDVLARGGVRCTFHSPEVSKEKYDEATQDFDLEKFLAKKPIESSEPKVKERKR
jgi:hypothetical protein